MSIEPYDVALKSASAGEQTVFLAGSNNCNLTTTIQGLTANLDVITTTPIITPYGFLSMPDQAYTAVIGNMGIRSQQPFVLGFSDGVQSTSPIALVPGETGLYNSTSYSFEVKLDELRARFNGMTCKIVSGTADQKLLSDIFGELIALVSYLNTQTQSFYNTHIHYIGGSAASNLDVTIPPLTIDTTSLTVVAPSGGGPCTVAGATIATAVTMVIPPATVSPPPASVPTTPPIVPITAYTYTNPIVADETYINNNQIFIDNNGVNPP